MSRRSLTDREREHQLTITTTLGKEGNSTSEMQQQKTTTGNVANETSEKKPNEDMSAETSPPKRSFLQRNAFIIAVTVNEIIGCLGDTVHDQYRYHYFHDKYQDQLSSYNVTRSGECGSEKLESEVQAIEDTISREAQKWSLYLDYASMVPMFISSIIIGMKSDQIGRRFLFFMPFIGRLIVCGHLTILIKLKLHFGWMVISTFISSCFGGDGVLMFAAFSMVSDTHGKKKPTTSSSSTTSPTPDCPTLQAKEEQKGEEKEKEEAEEEFDDNDMDMSRESSRTYKIVAVDVAVRLTSSATSFVTGYIIEYAGYFYCSLIVVSLTAMLLIFAFLFITETGQQKRNKGFRDSLRVIYKALKDPTKRITLIVINIAIYVFILGQMDEFTVLRTYQMSPPFCLASIQLGWIASEIGLRGIITMPLLWLWKRLSFSEPTIAAIGVLSYMASGFVLATIHQSWVFYAIPVITIPGTLVLTVTKAITTRLVGRAALASTFSVTLAAEQVFLFIGSISANYMYQYFLPTLPTAPFYMGGGFFCLATLIFTGLSLKEHCLSRLKETTKDENNVRPESTSHLHPPEQSSLATTANETGHEINVRL